MDIKKLADSIQRETEKIIVDKTHQIRLVIMSVLTGGHVLLDDLPGVGKTTLVKTLGLALGCSFKRLQFVPDMLPSDITGMMVYNQKTGDFELRQGPVMTNILLADEINRAIPRTQSALLEAMEEGQVTIDNTTFPLPGPFLVLATQNPVEMESTFHLPAAQMDRFLLRLTLGYPGESEEKRMLRVLGDEIPFSLVEKVTTPGEILEAQRSAMDTYVSDEVLALIVDICKATRSDDRLRMGASPRASRALYKASKTWARMEGRDYVTPDDVLTLLHPVLEHRLMLENTARLSGVLPSDILSEITASLSLSPTAADMVGQSDK